LFNFRGAGIVFPVMIVLIMLPVTISLSGGQERSYKIITAESSFWVYVGKSGFLSAFAHNHEIGIKSFSGSVTISDAGADSGAVRLEVDAKSLVVLDKKVNDDDRQKIFRDMHDKVLESEKYPKVSFRSTSVSNLKKLGGEDYSMTLNGDLILHGITKRIAVPMTATITSRQIRVKGKYPLRQSDYGIKPYSAAGGTIKVKDEVIVNFSIIAKS